MDLDKMNHSKFKLAQALQMNFSENSAINMHHIQQLAISQHRETDVLMANGEWIRCFDSNGIAIKWLYVARET